MAKQADLRHTQQVDGQDEECRFHRQCQWSVHTRRIVPGGNEPDGESQDGEVTRLPTWTEGTCLRLATGDSQRCVKRSRRLPPGLRRQSGVTVGQKGVHQHQRTKAQAQPKARPIRLLDAADAPADCKARGDAGAGEQDLVLPLLPGDEQHHTFCCQYERELQAGVFGNEPHGHEQQALRKIAVLRERLRCQDTPCHFRQHQQNAAVDQSEFPEAPGVHLQHRQQEPAEESPVVQGQEPRAILSGKLLVLRQEYRRGEEQPVTHQEPGAGP